MSKYLVNFNTGSGNEYAETLEDAMELAIDGASYTQKSITIEDQKGETIACLPWYGVEASEDDVITINFGNFGFYGEWQEF